MNRVWQFHFGKGLSTTPSDFGLVGMEPTHPDLLDFLATRLMDGDWSLKRLHRELLCSSFYQMTSRAVGGETAKASWKQSLQLDPENQLWSRFPRRRLDAESIRDAMLAVSGLLNPVIDGPGVRPPLPSELVKTLKSGQWKVSENQSDHYRRSIYIFARRNLTYPLFATFDRPAANCTCAERVPSTTPLQSLSLLNSEFTEQILEKMIRETVIHNPSLNQLRSEELLIAADDVYTRITQGKPSLEATQTMRYLILTNGATRERSEANKILSDLSAAFLNSNYFLYLD